MAKAPFYRAKRGARGVPRHPFHIRLEETLLKKLVALSKKLRLTGADVVRKLIEEA